MRCAESSSDVRSTAMSRNNSGPISFWPPSPRLFCTSIVRNPIPRANRASSALVSSSGCAGACIKVAETLSLRRARPSAACPLSCATSEKLMRFCARTRTLSGMVTRNARPATQIPASKVSGRFMCGFPEWPFRVRSEGTDLFPDLPVQMTVQKILVVFHAPPFHDFRAGLHAREDANVPDGPGVSFGIFPRHLVGHVIGIGVTQALGDMQRVAGRVFGGVDPRQIG